MVRLLRGKELVGLGFQGYLRSPPGEVLNYVIHHVPELSGEEISNGNVRMKGDMNYGESSVGILLDFSLEPKRHRWWSIRRPFRLGKLFHDFKFFMVSDNLTSLSYALDDLVVRRIEGLKKKEDFTPLEIERLRAETVAHCFDFYRENFGGMDDSEFERYLRLKVPA